MRKILTIILLMICLTTNAKHLEFMGIPINGTISSFQTKLLQKGCKVSKYSKSLPAGARSYTGTFAGNACTIFVNYNPSSKIVHYCTVFIPCGNSFGNAESSFNYYKNLLIKKYEGIALTSDMLEDVVRDNYNYEFIIFEPPIEVGAKTIGTISISIYSDEETYPAEYDVMIQYSDFENSKKIRIRY